MAQLTRSDIALAARRALVRDSMLDFVTHLHPHFSINWHHEVMAEKLTEFGKKKIRKMMFFLPPQHGKTEFATRNFPSWNFGLNPDCKTAICAYSYSKSQEYNTEVQRIMDTEEYISLFPETRLADSEYAGVWGKKRRSNEMFEILNTKEKRNTGFLKSGSVTGSLTGTPVDLLIIDDPVKDFIEASSPTIRERNWNWYMSVAETRLHNDSQILFIMTRWHQDDLAGRILEAERDEWEVVTFPAIKENDLNPYDPREIGDPLWPERHSLERMLKVKRKSPYIFNSLYQQKPTPDGSGDFSREQFEIIEPRNVPEGVLWDVYIDGAYSEKTKDDPTGIMLIGEYKRDVYIRHAESKFLKMPDLLNYLPIMLHNHGIDYKSTIYIEPKASGVSLYQMLRRKKKYNVRKIIGRLVQMGKTSRAKGASAVVGGGHVYLVKGHWNEEFIAQMISFPNGLHDEHVDNFSYFVHNKFGRALRGGLRHKN